MASRIDNGEFDLKDKRLRYKFVQARWTTDPGPYPTWRTDINRWESSSQYRTSAQPNAVDQYFNRCWGSTPTFPTNRNIIPIR